jgi:hypothetical protein
MCLSVAFRREGLDHRDAFLAVKLGFQFFRRDCAFHYDLLAYAERGSAETWFALSGTNGSSNDLNCRVVIRDQRGLCDDGSRGRLPEMDGARFRNVTVMQRGLCGFIVFHAAVLSHRSCTSPSANGES